MRSWLRLGTSLAWCALPGAALCQTETPEEAAEIVVIGVPMSGGLPADWVPANVQTLGTDDLSYPGATGMNDALSRRLSSVSAFDSLGTPLQGGLTLRGFTAAPALGEPQGVVVYQGPMRANEVFGDVVQWDLLPVFAVAEAQVISGSNPVYGLNGIGGAVALDMKDGFDADGLSAEAAAGSFGRVTGTAEYATHSGTVGFYMGANAIDEDGWRDFSPSRILRGFADVAWEDGDNEVGFSLTAADSELTGNGPAPADLLAERREAVFTHPDRTDSRLWAGALRYSFSAAYGLTLSGGGYYRRLTRSTVNGDRAEFEECEDFVGLVPGFIAPDEALCFGAEAEDGEVEGSPTVLVDEDGEPVEAYDGQADAVFNRTRTRSKGWGASAQATWKARLGGADNTLIAGATLEGARTYYRSGSEVGTLGPDRGVESLGVGIGNEEFNVGLRTRSRSVSVYASNTFSPSATLHLTAALRWNRADLRLRDQIGTALNGDHEFSRANPAVGLSWNAMPSLTAYASFAENNRVPTPAELSCADPARPCRFPNAFLADPPLDDVRARTYEAGLRGRITRGGSNMSYSLAAFTTTSRDDIIFISAGPIVGTGYFDNVRATRRRGIEANAEGRAGPVSWFASYALVDATFSTPLAIRSPNNPSANENGEVDIEPGDRIPGVPRHVFKAGADFDLSAAFTVGAELVAASNRPLRGDEGNDERKMPGFAVVNASASYRIGALQLFGRVENLLDADYETFGLYGEAEELGFENPRFLSPGAPRSFIVGVSASF